MPTLKGGGGGRGASSLSPTFWEFNGTFRSILKKGLNWPTLTRVKKFAPRSLKMLTWALTIALALALEQQPELGAPTQLDGRQQDHLNVHQRLLQLFTTPPCYTDENEKSAWI